MLKRLLRDVTPPVLLRLYRNWGAASRTIYFRKCSGTWADALRKSSGYFSKEIVDKVTRATESVLRGDELFERDSVCFSEPAIRWSILGPALLAVTTTPGPVRVLDFGGSLASAYFQHRSYLAAIPGLKWGVVEQPSFVEWGKKHLENETLRFYASLDECLSELSPTICVFGSVLQYLEDPYRILPQAIDSGCEWIVIDRTPLDPHAECDYLTIQSVPEEIYKASYPCWILSRIKLLATLGLQFVCVSEFPCDDFCNLPAVQFRGLVFRRRQCAVATYD